ncbi:MAG: CBS domain-containing protein [Acidimicrobiaceae bacterium]|nr:CBS domain-containing protein [Acidimicrobiaceae bacterium]
MLLDVFLPIGLLIVVAKLLEGALGRFGLSSIIAFTLTGVLLGPATGIVEPNHDLNLFLEIGIFVLFFLVGLDEIDVPGFVATMRGRYFAAAIISVLISLVAALVVTSDIFGVDLGLELAFGEALALAGILSLSSLGLAAKVLSDAGTLKQPIGLKIFTIVIIAEIASLLVVGFTIGEHGHDLNATTMLALLGKITAFVVVAWLLSAKVLPVVIVSLQRIFNVPELSFGLLLGGLFLVVVGAENMGLHGTIGALLFGAALSGLSQGVRDDIMPGMRSASEGFFVPLFFASAGLHFDLSFLDLSTVTALALVVVPLAGKFAGAFIGTYVTRIDAPFALATGLMSKGVAEIAFLLVLLELDVIPKEIFSLLVLTMFGYILFMPAILNFAVKRAELSDHPSLPDTVTPSFARYALEGVKVRTVLDATREYPGSHTSVAEFVDAWTMPNQHDYLVVDEGRVSGIVSTSGLHSVRRGSDATSTLGKVMRASTLNTGPDEPIHDALERMTNASQTVIPVTDPESGRFLGSVTSADVIHLVVLMNEIEAELQQMETEEP